MIIMRRRKPNQTCNSSKWINVDFAEQKKITEFKENITKSKSNWIETNKENKNMQCKQKNIVELSSPSKNNE